MTIPLSPPSDTIKDAMEERDWRPVHLAIAMRIGYIELFQILYEDAPITEDIAAALATSIGGTADFWLRRELQYRAGLLNKHAQLIKDTLPDEDLERIFNEVDAEFTQWHADYKASGKAGAELMDCDLAYAVANRYARHVISKLTHKQALK